MLWYFSEWFKVYWNNLDRYMDTAELEQNKIYFK